MGAKATTHFFRLVELSTNPAPVTGSPSVHHVRAPQVVHVDDSVDPVRDLETIQHELCAKDAAYVDAAEAIALKDVRKTPDMKLPLRFYAVFEKARALLAAGKPVRDGEWTGPEVETVSAVVRIQ